MILGPILEDTAIAAVGDEFVWKLGDLGVEDIHYHVLDGFALVGFCGVEMERVRFHWVTRYKTVPISLLKYNLI
jgi:hypothetical protein